MTRKATRHPLFRRWCSLRHYIRNATPTKYPAYYGVKIDPDWNNSFWAFADFIDENWSISTLDSNDVFDRIDNDKPYEPGNVRFTDRKGNARSRRNTHYVTYKGQTRALSEWAEITGIEFSCLFSRIEAGWPLAQAFGYKKRK